MSFFKYLRRDSLLQLAGLPSLSRNCMHQTCRSLIIETAPPESVKLNRLSGSDSGENAVFGLPETGLAIIPGAGGTQRLSRLVGRSVSKELIFTGRKIDAREAAHTGL
ncbi:hypothetical protein EUTSA_v10026747mg [Eutrema salsugineum]|uniref:Uncharacterized protein n=1 Tax=Eutrema salsugineum TaxID=72664 RepID=V4LYJ4_EUTSA|nr:hypothetical protein EUTSA_v10026747mg [Eutrema salsugineum]